MLSKNRILAGSVLFLLVVGLLLLLGVSLDVGSGSLFQTLIWDVYGMRKIEPR